MLHRRACSRSSHYRPSRSRPGSSALLARDLSSLYPPLLAALFFLLPSFRLAAAFYPAFGVHVDTCGSLFPDYPRFCGYPRLRAPTPLAVSPTCCCCRRYFVVLVARNSERLIDEGSADALSLRGTDEIPRGLRPHPTDCGADDDRKRTEPSERSRLASCWTPAREACPIGLVERAVVKERGSRERLDIDK